MCVVRCAYERCAQSERLYALTRVTHAAACALFVGMICDWCLRDAAMRKLCSGSPIVRIIDCEHLFDRSLLVDIRFIIKSLCRET
jgi:hypothetical protein